MDFFYYYYFVIYRSPVLESIAAGDLVGLFSIVNAAELDQERVGKDLG